MYSKIFQVLSIVIMLFFAPVIPAYSNTSESDGTQTEESAGKFNPGDFMFDHIKDAHEWHLLSIGTKHYSILLPVILYSKNSGVHVFMSSRFHHGHESYQGF